MRPVSTAARAARADQAPPRRLCRRAPLPAAQRLSMRAIASLSLKWTTVPDIAVKTTRIAAACRRPSRERRPCGAAAGGGARRPCAAATPAPHRRHHPLRQRSQSSQNRSCSPAPPPSPLEEESGGQPSTHSSQPGCGAAIAAASTRTAGKVSEAHGSGLPSRGNAALVAAWRRSSDCEDGPSEASVLGEVEGAWLMAAVGTAGTATEGGI
jgi:hypothetical protein